LSDKRWLNLGNLARRHGDVEQAQPVMCGRDPSAGNTACRWATYLNKISRTWALALLLTWRYGVVTIGPVVAAIMVLAFIFFQRYPLGQPSRSTK